MGEKKGYRFRTDLNAWWPDYDHAPEKCIQFVRHGLPAIDTALPFCRDRRVAIQAGGHAGFWPKALAEKFGTVLTFEPEPVLFQCLLLNCPAENVHAFRLGLGAQAGHANFKSHVSAGSWRVDDAGEHQIGITTIDGFLRRDVDAIFLDIEGYEVEALKGAAETIKHCRPMILCELLPRSRQDIERWLTGEGYTMAARYGRDGVFIPKEYA